jgi:hypothetical protein
MGTTCRHENFNASVMVGRLTRDEGGPVIGYAADVQIQCAQCGLPFRFVGVSAGVHHSEPRVSVDGMELRAPIEPATHERFAASASYTMPPRKESMS